MKGKLKTLTESAWKVRFVTPAVGVYEASIRIAGDAIRGAWDVIERSADAGEKALDDAFQDALCELANSDLSDAAIRRFLLAYGPMTTPRRRATRNAEKSFRESRKRWQRERDGLQETWERIANGGSPTSIFLDPKGEHVVVTALPATNTIRIRFTMLALAMQNYLGMMPAKNVAVCENPTCPARFYFRGNPKQRFCSKTDECARFLREVQNERNLDYYYETGAKRRRAAARKR